MGFQLTSALQHIDNISVVAFQMIKNLSENVTDLKELTTRIGAQFFLTGGVETLKDRIRVSIELVKATGFEQIWSDFFDKKISETDIFDLEDEIVKSALNELRGWFNNDPVSLHKLTLMPVGRTKAVIG